MPSFTGLKLGTVFDVTGVMVCTTTEPTGTTWLLVQDEEKLVAIIRLTASMLTSAPTLHTMIGVGWVRVTQVTVTRIIEPGIMWEADTSSNSIISTALPDLEHPHFSVGTQQRVCEGDRVPETTNSSPFIFSLMNMQLPEEWNGDTEGRPWYTPFDRVYVHLINNELMHDPWYDLMGTSVVISFVEVKKFVQAKHKKYWPGEICLSISTTSLLSLPASSTQINFLLPSAPHLD